MKTRFHTRHCQVGNPALRTVMTRHQRTAAALIILTSLPGGCAGPGVLRNLPDPVFASPAQHSQPKAAVTARPAAAPLEPIPPQIDGATIVVDAGHGGQDPGATGVGPLPEKAINLSIAMRLANLLEEAGAEVITTRAADRFIALDDRAGLAERSRADLFVSIHSDAAGRASAAGATVYIARGAAARSEQAARRIVAALRRAGIECRGIGRAGFRVLVGHSRPAVLVECGFLTNHDEARRLSTPSYQADIAAAIAEGIADHFAP